jgi:hypothetical protein
MVSSSRLIRIRYKDISALKAHGKFPEFKEMGRKFAKEGLLRSPMEVYPVKAVAGFASKL